MGGNTVTHIRALNHSKATSLKKIMEAKMLIVTHRLVLSCGGTFTDKTISGRLYTQIEHHNVGIHTCTRGIITHHGRRHHCEYHGPHCGDV